MSADRDLARETMTFSSARQMFGALRRLRLAEGHPAAVEDAESRVKSPADEATGTKTKMTKPGPPEIREAGIT